MAKDYGKVVLVSIPVQIGRVPSLWSRRACLRRSDGLVLQALALFAHVCADGREGG